MAQVVLRVSSVIAAFSMASACHAQYEEMISAGYCTACLWCTDVELTNGHISSDWVWSDFVSINKHGVSFVQRCRICCGLMRSDKAVKKRGCERKGLHQRLILFSLKQQHTSLAVYLRKL